jgi:hypothetical protein
MNEQIIKDLSERAQRYARYCMVETVRELQSYDAMVISERYAKDFEKRFAELIVKECISALDKEVYIATREDGEQACHEVILLEHFDIDE